jgi:NADH:ubiquinone oxidoreductase subunit K
VAFWRYNPGTITGQVFAVIVFAVAAAEVAVGLALIISLYRRRQSVVADEIDLMKW